MAKTCQGFVAQAPRLGPIWKRAAAWLFRLTCFYPEQPPFGGFGALSRWLTQVKRCKTSHRLTVKSTFVENEPCKGHSGPW